MTLKTLTQPADDTTAPPALADHLYLACGAGAPGGARWSLTGVDAIEIGRGAARAAKKTGTTLRIDCPDPWMSSRHLRFEREVAHWVAIDLGSRNGFLVGGARTSRAVVLDHDVVEAGRTFFVLRTHEPALPAGDTDITAPRELATLDPVLARAYDELVRVAPSNVPVLVAGPTGAGKERVARAVHAASGRRGALVPVNCGALPAGLVESELFGHKKGAFSGAIADHAGLVAASSGGTLFLDEIGDLPLPAQAALLRVLEEREVRAVGATAAVAVDLRIVAASHRDLDAMIADGRFREDLYARLAGYELALPPLAERKIDLGLMLATLLPPSTVLAAATTRALFAYAWPRNIRELARVTERAVALAAGGELLPAHLPDEIAQATWPARTAAGAESDDRKIELVRLLEKHRGNVSKIAAEMGRVRQQVQRWLKRYGLDPERYR
ncbi:MAG TPA: sigma 54-interacting transcriptional regulator [Kofleriaceae bacterium]|nr:sigma 54-interacting transcriptional regulator [Kofleriaceae bacterium]